MMPPDMAPMPGQGMGMQGAPQQPAPMPPIPVEQPPQKLHDVTVVRRKNYGCVKVVPVPPEEFGWGRNTRRIQDTDYCFHEVPRREADLIEEGFDAAQVKALPVWSTTETGEQVHRDTVDEGDSDNLNRAMRKVKIIEHYIRLDYEGDGKPCLYRVTTGANFEVLRRKGKPEIIKEDHVPFAVMSPIIVTHRLCGRSMADLVKDIQRIKTAILRGVLDNIYLALNPRPEVAESHAGDTTLDDLMVWRPGAPIRTRQPGGLVWQNVPTIAQHAFPVMEYMDATREWRTGVTRQGQGIDANSLQNQSATAVNQMFTAAQARMRLIARIFAETGMRDMFALIHAKVLKHENKTKKVRLRNKWVTVDPRVWKTREDMTINVGLGTGDRSQQFAKIMQLIGLQAQALQMGLATPENLYNSAKEVTKVLGLKSVDLFFTDPAQNPQAGQQPPNPEMIKAEAEVQKIQMEGQLRQQEMQAKAQIEQVQAQADIATQERKTGAEIHLAERKFELERDMKILEAQLKMQMHESEMQFKAQENAQEAMFRATENRQESEFRREERAQDLDHRDREFEASREDAERDAESSERIAREKIKASKKGDK